MHSHIGCICLTFLHCAFSNVPSMWDSVWKLCHSNKYWDGYHHRLNCIYHQTFECNKPDNISDMFIFIYDDDFEREANFHPFKSHSIKSQQRTWSPLQWFFSAEKLKPLGNAKDIIQQRISSLFVKDFIHQSFFLSFWNAWKCQRK